jgi:hypothetical protein
MSNVIFIYSIAGSNTSLIHFISCTQIHGTFKGFLCTCVVELKQKYYASTAPTAPILVLTFRHGAIGARVTSIGRAAYKWCGPRNIDQIHFWAGGILYKLRFPWEGCPSAFKDFQPICSRCSGLNNDGASYSHLSNMKSK